MLGLRSWVVAFEWDTDEHGFARIFSFGWDRGFQIGIQLRGGVVGSL